LNELVRGLWARAEWIPSASLSSSVAISVPCSWEMGLLCRSQVPGWEASPPSAPPSRQVHQRHTFGGADSVSLHVRRSCGRSFLKNPQDLRVIVLSLKRRKHRHKMVKHHMHPRQSQHIQHTPTA
jgi:hypothetical protein